MDPCLYVSARDQMDDLLGRLGTLACRKGERLQFVHGKAKCQQQAGGKRLLLFVLRKDEYFLRDFAVFFIFLILLFLGLESGKFLTGRSVIRTF